MKRVLILTGAGASVPFGYLTTYEFFNDLSYLDEKEKVVINELKSYLGLSKIDVENVLRTLEPIRDFLNRKPGDFISNRINNSWGDLIPKLIDKLNHRCFYNYGSINERESIENIFSEFIDTIFVKYGSDVIFDFFTTNYDPVHDCIIDHLENDEYEVSDGFNNRMRWSNKYINNKPGFNFYRLHGALSWIDQDGIVQNTRDYSARDANFKVKNVLIYPGYKGDPSRNKDSKVYDDVHKRFTQSLKSSEVLIVIGFSFRDPHITRLINSNNNKLKIIYINPGEPKGTDVSLPIIKHTFKNRFYHIDDYFGNETYLKSLHKIITANLI